MYRQEIMRFWQLIRRDLWVYKHRFHTLGINNGIIMPIIFVITFGYLMPLIYFGPDARVQGNTLFIGNVIVLLTSVTFALTIPLLNDRQGARFIEYQLTLFNPRALLLEMIVFAALFTGTLFLSFFPLAKLMLGDLFDTSATSWVNVILVLYAGSFCLAAYNLLAVCVMTQRKQGITFWIRCNFPLFTLGGLTVPWYIMNKLSPLLGAVTLLNPFVYISEGLRAAIMGGDDFFAVSTCVAMLVLFTVAFTVATFWVFKKRMDHI